MHQLSTPKIVSMLAAVLVMSATLAAADEGREQPPGPRFLHRDLFLRNAEVALADNGAIQLPEAGETVVVAFTIRNRGPEPSGPLRVVGVLSQNHEFSEFDEPIFVVEVHDLGPGEEFVQRLPYVMPDVERGPHVLGLDVTENPGTSDAREYTGPTAVAWCLDEMFPRCPGE